MWLYKVKKRMVSINNDSEGHHVSQEKPKSFLLKLYYVLCLNNFAADFNSCLI